MKKRKQHNLQARLQRNSRAILRLHGAAVFQIDPENIQGLISLKTGRLIPPGQTMADAMCDVPHAWTIYFGAFCTYEFGHYLKSEEVALQGIYRAEHLADVIEDRYRALIDSCNPNHMVGSGWIANPCGISMDEAQAARMFEAVGAWTKMKEVA